MTASLIVKSVWAKLSTKKISLRDDWLGKLPPKGLKFLANFISIKNGFVMGIAAVIMLPVSVQKDLRLKITF